MPQSRKTMMISPAPAARILINAGAKRVSAEAAKEFSEVILSAAQAIAAKAVIIAKHSGRKTVNAEDIKISLK